MNSANRNPSNIKSENALQKTMKQVMLRMVSTEGGELARRRVPVSELVYHCDEYNKQVQDVVADLIDARLIVKGREPDGAAYIEPAHDALIRGWNRLLQWTQDEHEQLTLRPLVTSAANNWKTGNGGLWHSDPRLPLLARISGLDESWFNDAELEFTKASLTSRRKRFLYLTVSAVIAFAAMAVLTTLMYFERNRANANATREAKAREDTQWQLGVSQVAQARAHQLAGNWNASIETAEQASNEFFSIGSNQYLSSRALADCHEHTIIPIDRIVFPRPIKFMVIGGDGVHAIVGIENELLLWNINERRVAKKASTPSSMVAITAAAASNRLYTQDSDNTVRAWEFNADSLTNTHKWTSEKRISAIATSNDGMSFAVANESGQIAVYEHPSMKPRWTLEPGDTDIEGLAITNSIDRADVGFVKAMIVYSKEKLVGWHLGQDEHTSRVLSTGKHITNCEISHDYTVAAFDGQPNSPGSVQTWNTFTWQGVSNWTASDNISNAVFSNQLSTVVCTMRRHSGQFGSNVEFSTKEYWVRHGRELSARESSLGRVRNRYKNVAFAISGNVATLWDFSKQRFVSDFESTGPSYEVGQPPISPYQVGVSRDGNLIVAGCVTEPAVVVFDRHTQKRLLTLQHTGIVSACEVACDQEHFLTGNKVGQIMVWTLDGRKLRTINASDAPIASLAATDDGCCIALSADGDVQTWNITTGRQLSQLTIRDPAGVAHRWTKIGLSRDDEFLVAANSNGRIQVWSRQDEGMRLDWNTGIEEAVVKLSPVGNLAFVGGRRGLQIWDYRKGKLLHKLVALDVNSLDCTSDGRLLFVGCGRAYYPPPYTRNAEFRVLDVDSAKLLRTEKLSEPISSIQVLPGDNAALLHVSSGVRKGAHFQLWDLEFAGSFRSLLPKVTDALNTSDSERAPAQIDLLGRWQAAHHYWEFANRNCPQQTGPSSIASLERARISWMAGDPQSAIGHFDDAIKNGEAPEHYLELCKVGASRELSHGEQEIDRLNRQRSMNEF